MNNTIDYREIRMGLNILLRKLWSRFAPRDPDLFDESFTVGELLSDSLELKGMSVEDLEALAELEPGYLKPLIAGEARLTPELALKLEPVIGDLAEQLYFYQVALDHYEQHGKWPPSPSPETARAIRKQLGR